MSSPQHSGFRMFDADGDPIDLGDLTIMQHDFSGRRGFNTVFGEAVVGWRTDSVSCQFQYGNSARDVTSTLSGSGTADNADSMAAVKVTGAIGSALLTSKDAVRYRPGHECTAQFTSMYVGAQAGVKQYHGFLNGVDGMAFGTKDGVFGAWYIASSVETFVPSTEFNGDVMDGTGSGFVHDSTKLNIYMVQYGWLGVAPMVFSVYMGHLLGWRVVHTIDRANTVITPNVGNPSLPVAVKVVRAAGSGTAAAVHTASWRAGVTAGEAEDNSSERWFTNAQLDFAPAGVANTRYNVLTLSNATTYLGKPNHVTWELGVLTFDNSTNRTLAVFGTKGATLTGAAAPVAVDAANSVTSYILGGTVTGGTQDSASVVRKDTGFRADTRGTGVKVYPGETLTLEIQGTQAYTGTFSLSARWRELF